MTLLKYMAEVLTAVASRRRRRAVSFESKPPPLPNFCRLAVHVSLGQISKLDKL